MGRAAMWASYRRADLRRQEEQMLGALSDTRTEPGGVGRLWVEVGDCFLEPRDNLSRGLSGLFRQVAIQFFAKANLDAGHPKAS
jgi:hypothetical protein